MKFAVCAGALLALGLTAGTGLAAEHAAHAVPAYIRAAVDDPSRPEKDRMRDVNRKPAEVLAFAGVKPGEQIGELMPDGGYYTRLLCRVVGDSGHVYGVDFKPHMPPRPAGAAPKAPPARAPLGCNNVTSSTVEASELMLPAGLDVVWTTENYHDMHDPFVGSPDILQLDTAVYDALKPGGLFIIEDHAAEPDSGARDTNTLHRIDPALVEHEVERAGFQLVGESTVLRNRADDHTQKVFTMVDKTDRFLFKFRKPAA